MKPILALLFLSVCVYASKVRLPYPRKPYLAVMKDIEKVVSLLQEHVLSLADEDKVSDLRDYRRQYTEILYTIKTLAVTQSNCIYYRYFLSYQDVVNLAKETAVNDTQKVINETKLAIEIFYNTTHNILDEVSKCFQWGKLCDAIVDINLNQYDDALQQKLVYFAGGKAAREFLKIQDRILREAKQHNANRYLKYAAKKLRKLVLAFADLYAAYQPTHDISKLC